MGFRLVCISVCLVMALIACEPKPSQQYTTGDVLLTESFNESDSWENFSTNDGADFAVEDGVYHAYAPTGGFIWGLNEENHTDVVIEVLAKQNSSHEDNFYGVMCRADPSNNGDGYYFLVSGDGYAAIAYGHGTEVDPLVGPTQTNAVNKGTGNNMIRAVCIGDYLALYSNGTFVIDVTHSEYTSGYAGLAVSSNEASDASADDSVDISFDNLTIWAASIGTG
jgi:hypothetical protein